MIKDKRQDYLKKWIDLISPNEDGTQAIYNAMSEYAKEIAIDYLSWVNKTNIKDEKLFELYKKEKQLT